MIPLHFRDGHIFLEIGGSLWLFDTGAPTSFGSREDVMLAGSNFRLADAYLGLDAATLTRFVGVECAGLFGADILGKFDFLLDFPNGTAEVSPANLESAGQAVSFADNFMGIPIVSARIGGTEHRMFFDTGAQISYFQHDSLTAYPPAGGFSDFYPGVGQFRTETYHVDVSLGAVDFVIRCGALPKLIAATLMMAGAVGIIGNQILRDRRVGYFPRRHLLVLS